MSNDFYEQEPYVVTSKKTYKGVKRINWTMILMMVISAFFLFLTFGDVVKQVKAKNIIEKGFEADAVTTKVVKHHRRRQADEYKLYVSYEVDGERYNDIYLYTTTTFTQKGQQIKIYYNPDYHKEITNEAAAKVNMFNIILYIACAIIFGFIAVDAYRNPDKVAKNFFKPRGFRRYR